MSHSRLITIGVLIFILGVILDFCLIQFSILIILTGNILAIFGCLKFLEIKSNRQRVLSALRPKANMTDFFKDFFDLSWSKVSIIWTTCAVGAMIIVHIGGLFKISGAYKTARESIIHDSQIINEIGEVTHFTYLVTGGFTTNGYSNMDIGVIGKKGRTYVKAIVYGQDGEYYTDELLIKK
jgi:hypothetical protein